MSTEEIRELLLDLQGLALETEQADLGQLPEAPSSEIERRLLRGVICRAEAALGLKNQIE